MRLCTTCNALDVAVLLSTPDSDHSIPAFDASYFFCHENTDRYRFRHSNSLSQAQERASQGCELCRIVVDATSTASIANNNLVYQYPIVLYEGWNCTINFALDVPEDGLLDLCEMQISVGNVRSSSLPFLPRKKLHTNPQAPQYLQLARQWLRHCLENDTCGHKEESVWPIKVRFMHVGDEQKDPCLMEYDSHQVPQEWAALSYCWGPGSSLQLKADTAWRIKKGIPLRDLDQTIRDAILVTRALGIDHIWIDALCIYQDKNRQDWFEQARSSRNIYKRSTVTLVPDEAKAVTDGFLGPRPQRYVSVRCSMIDAPNDAYPLLLHQVRKANHQSLTTGPWTKRAWTFQGGLLPHRVLYYTSSGMIWECQDHVWHEDGSEDQPQVEIVKELIDEGGKNYFDYSLSTRFKLREWYVGSPACHTRMQKYLLWYLLVEDFTARQIKDPADRLIAISGVASQYAQVLNQDEYLAGLWRSDLVRGLVWHIRGARLLDAGLDRLTCHRLAPTWSWASTGVTQSIGNDYDHQLEFKSLISIDRVDIKLADVHNNYGTVERGMITLTGSVLRFSCLYHAEWKLTSTPISEFERHLSRVLEADYGESAKQFTCAGVYAAILMIRALPPFDWRIDALLLKACSASQPTTFERLGVIKLSIIPDQLKASPRLTKMKEQAERSVRRRLFPNRGFRRSKRISCPAVFSELRTHPWTRETIRIV